MKFKLISRKTLAVTVLLLLAVSQSLAEGPSISGFVNSTFTYSLDKPDTGIVMFRSFDLKDNTFAVNAAHFVLSGSLGESGGYVVEIDAGSDIVAITGNAIDIQEAYLTYSASMLPVGLKVGRFVTFNGIEVIESKDNPTISRGHLFGLAEPYTHTGWVVNSSLKQFDFALGLVNSWLPGLDDNSEKTIIAKLTGNFGDMLTFTTSAYSGVEDATGDMQKNTFDLTGVTKLLPKTALWFQYNQGKHDVHTWNGFGIQPWVSLTDKLTLGLRYEAFNDEDGYVTGITHSSNNITICPAWKLSDNVTIRGEYRMDSADQEIWEDDANKPLKSISTVSVELIGTF